jgi:GxxExxY protein
MTSLASLLQTSFVNQTVVVELKAMESLGKAHEVPLVNYLMATGVPVGLLLNFGPDRVSVRRKVRQLFSPCCQS